MKTQLKALVFSLVSFFAMSAPAVVPLEAFKDAFGGAGCYSESEAVQNWRAEMSERLLANFNEFVAENFSEKQVKAFEAAYTANPCFGDPYANQNPESLSAFDRAFFELDARLRAKKLPECANATQQFFGNALGLRMGIMRFYAGTTSHPAPDRTFSVDEMNYLLTHSSPLDEEKVKAAIAERQVVKQAITSLTEKYSPSEGINKILRGSGFIGETLSAEQERKVVEFLLIVHKKFSRLRCKRLDEILSDEVGGFVFKRASMAFLTALVGVSLDPKYGATPEVYNALGLSDAAALESVKALL